MSTPDPCPALLHDGQEDRVVCVREPSIPGAWCFICWLCLGAMLKGAADREAVRQEWDVEAA